MTRPRKGDWLKWLTTEECVYLCWLTIKPWPYKDEWRKRQRIQAMRTRASHRRKARKRKWTIYLEAMED